MISLICRILNQESESLTGCFSWNGSTRVDRAFDMLAAVELLIESRKNDSEQSCHQEREHNCTTIDAESNDCSWLERCCSVSGMSRNDSLYRGAPMYMKLEYICAALLNALIAAKLTARFEAGRGREFDIWRS